MSILIAVVASSIFIPNTAPPDEGSVAGVKLRIPNGATSTDLLDFPIMIDLADLGDTFWSGVASGGGNIRVKDASGASVPIDLIKCDTATKTGRLFAKKTIFSGIDTHLFVSTVAGASALAANDPIGRNAVWSDYTAVYAFESMTDRTGGGRDMVRTTNTGTLTYGPVSVNPPVDVHQGVAYDGTNYYAIDTATVKKLDANWVLQAVSGTVWTLAGITANHCGDSTIYNGELFVPVETYPSGPYTNQWVVVLDPVTLTFKRKYDISAQLHEVSSITWDETNGYFVITSYENPTSLYKYAADFTFLGTITIPSTGSMQGITYYNGFFYITAGALYKLSLDGATRTTLWSGSIGTMEGIESKGDGTMMILFDSTPSAVYNFVPTAQYETPGWLNVDGTSQAKSPAMPLLTSWSYGASIKSRNVAATGPVLSYTPDITATTGRETLAVRQGGAVGIWNSTDGWVSGQSVLVSEEHRLHGNHDGVASRKVYIDGRLAGTDTTVVQRPPAATTPVLYIGAESLALAEHFVGGINYAYLRAGILSDSWIAAEGLNWVKPSEFYQVIPPDEISYSKTVVNSRAGLDATGWVQRLNSPLVRLTTRYKSWPAAFGLGNVSKTLSDQDIAIPATALADVDAGLATIECPWWQANNFEGDVGGATLEFLDSVGTTLMRRWSDLIEVPGNGNFAQRVLKSPIPPGSRTVRFGFAGVRAIGTENSSYFDNIGPIKFMRQQDYTHKLLLWLSGTSVTGKVDVTGVLATKVQNYWSAADNGFVWSAPATVGESYFPITIATADYASIDTGLCRLDVWGMQSSLDATLDIGRFYVEFRDGGGAILGTRAYSNPSEYYANIYGTSRTLDLAVPAGTRTIRWGMVGTKAAGASTVIDTFQKWISVFLKVPQAQQDFLELSGDAGGGFLELSGDMSGGTSNLLVIGAN